MLTSFPHYVQLDAMDCGPACLRMIAKYYGRSYNQQNLREKCFITREGVSMLGISDAAESIGMHTQGVKITLEQLIDNLPLPCILHWNQNHFVVLYKISRKKGFRHCEELRGTKQDEAIHNDDYKSKNNFQFSIFNFQFYIADPAGEKYIMNQEEFCRCWYSSKNKGKETGTALLLQPSPDFYDYEDDKEKQEKNLGHYFRYLLPYKSQYAQIIVGMILGMVMSLIAPFLTQAVVDQGIGNNNLPFITLILIAQLVLSITQMGMGFICQSKGRL